MSGCLRCGTAELQAVGLHARFASAATRGELPVRAQRRCEHLNAKHAIHPSFVVHLDPTSCVKVFLKLCVSGGSMVSEMSQRPQQGQPKSQNPTSTGMLHASKQYFDGMKLGLSSHLSSKRDAIASLKLPCTW